MTAGATIEVALPRAIVEGMDIDRVAELERGQDSGAVWQVISRHGDTLTVALLRCDGGEEMDRFTSDDSRLRAFVGDRFSSQE